MTADDFLRTYGPARSTKGDEDVSAFPKVFGGMFRVVPTHILERIDALLDEQIALVPAAGPDREFLKSQILDYVDRTGVIPEFSLVPRDPAGIEADLAEQAP